MQDCNLWWIKWWISDVLGERSVQKKTELPAIPWFKSIPVNEVRLFRGNRYCVFQIMWRDYVTQNWSFLPPPISQRHHLKSEWRLHVQAASFTVLFSYIYIMTHSHIYVSFNLEATSTVAYVAPVLCLWSPSWYFAVWITDFPIFKLANSPVELQRSFLRPGHRNSFAPIDFLTPKANSKG